MNRTPTFVPVFTFPRSDPNNSFKRRLTSEFNEEVPPNKRSKDIDMSIPSEKDFNNLKEYTYLYLKRIFDWVDTLKQTLITTNVYRNDYVSLNLLSESYSDQYKRIGSKQQSALDDLYKKYSMQIDYIDMVHDATYCNELLVDYKTINDKLCSTSNQIRVSVSHDLHTQYLQEYIIELRKLGFILPGIENPTKITTENAIRTLYEYETATIPVYVAHESGRSLSKFIGNIGDFNIQEIKQNAIGMIDGCSGDKCVYTSTPLTWSCDVAGIIHYTITSTNPRNYTITTKVDGLYYDIVFEVNGKIIADDVARHLYLFSGLFKKRRNTNSPNQITLPGNFDKQNNLHLLALFGLKTLCDKRIQQRIQTDYKHPNNPIRLITTVDKYVFAGTLLAYLGNKIDYCPTVLESVKNGYVKRSFGGDSNVSNDLFLRYTFYRYFDSLSEVETNSPKQIDPLTTTSEYIVYIIGLTKTQEHEYDNFWDFLKKHAIASQKPKWDQQLDTLREKVSDIRNQLDNAPAYMPGVKTDNTFNDNIRKALIQIPVVIPSIIDIYIAFEAEEDNFDIWSDNIFTFSTQSVLPPLTRISVEESYLKITYSKLFNTNEYKKFTSAIEELDNEGMYIENDINNHYVYIPISAELLIHIAQNTILPSHNKDPGFTLRTDYWKRIGNTLYDRVESWFSAESPLKNRNIFVNVFIESCKTPSNTQYNQIISELSNKRGGKRKTRKRRRFLHSAAKFEGKRRRSHVFSYDAPTSHLQKISGFLTRRYAPLQKTLIIKKRSLPRTKRHFLS